jgi:hypothetical protein
MDNKGQSVTQSYDPPYLIGKISGALNVEDDYIPQMMERRIVDRFHPANISSVHGWSTANDAVSRDNLRNRVDFLRVLPLTEDFSLSEDAIFIGNACWYDQQWGIITVA